MLWLPFPILFDDELFPRIIKKYMKTKTTRTSFPRLTRVGVSQKEQPQKSYLRARVFI
jgi:hypothetical protein